MAGRTIYDPLRRKDVALTPEEAVRQWFIGVLRDQLKVPMLKMMSEVGISSGDDASALGSGGKKVNRADIMVYDRESEPLMVVECKRPDVELTRSVLEQAIRYAALFGAVRYLAVTNGKSTYFAESIDGNLVFTDRIPTYQEMVLK
ncbi:MAG: type I restriction enzyme HsdR N-terminal domain-containing protein [Candidatus Cryptobacteroides sp.]